METKTQSRVGGRCRLLASRIVIPPGAVRPSSCPAAWLSVRLCLLASYAPRVSSAHPLPTGFAACLIRLSFSSAHRLAFLPRIARLPAPSTSGAGRNHNRRRGGGGEWLTAAAWLLAYPGWRREVIGCGWRRAAGVMALLSVRGRPACLPSWRWTGRLGHLFSPHLIGSSNRLRSPGASHRRGGGFFSFSPDPLPPALLGLLAWGLFPRPRPGDVSVAAWLAAAGGRTCSLACYRARVALSLRSFARCYMLRVACVVVSTCGVVGRFTGYFVRLLVGVSVFKYMPLNRILWLLTGIFGDVVCCPFSALSAASFPPLCPAFRPFPVAVSWRWRGRFPAVS